MHQSYTPTAPARSVTKWIVEKTISLSPINFHMESERHLPYEYREIAEKFRRNGLYQDAAEYYTTAAYGCLMHSRPLPEHTDEKYRPVRDPIEFSYGIRNFLYGALCYQFSNQVTRCQNHCRQAILILTSYKDTEQFGEAARNGICYELIGDFRLVGDLGRHNAAYERAAEHYESIAPERHHNWQLEPEFAITIMQFLNLAEAVNIDFDTEDYVAISIHSLSHRINAKQEWFPEVVQRILERGNWE